MINKKLIIDGDTLSLDKIEYFLNENPILEISRKSINKINRSRALVEKWVNSDEPIYGVTTGFGEFSNVRISQENIRKLQENLILSHAAGCGDN